MLKIGYKAGGSNTVRIDERVMKKDSSGRHNSSVGSGILRADKTPLAANASAPQNDSFQKMAAATVTSPEANTNIAAFLTTGKSSLM